MLNIGTGSQYYGKSDLKYYFWENNQEATSVQNHVNKNTFPTASKDENFIIKKLTKVKLNF